MTWLAKIVERYSSNHGIQMKKTGCRKRMTNVRPRLIIAEGGLTVLVHRGVLKGKKCATIRERYSVKPQMKKTLPKTKHEESLRRVDGDVHESRASPAKVTPIAEGETFRVIRGCSCHGSLKSDSREGFASTVPKKRKATFVEPNFTKARVRHVRSIGISCLNIIGVKENPNAPMYTPLGVITKGTIIEVDVSRLWLETSAGEVIQRTDAQITNNPETDGFVEAAFLD